MAEDTQQTSAVPQWAADIPLEKPLAILDIESTGAAPHRDRIIELSILKVLPGGGSESQTWRINPGIPIPAETSDIHGIYDEDVARKPEFRRLAPQVAEFLRDCDLVGFGIAQFDLPILRIEFERADCDFPMDDRRIIDAKTIYHKREPRTLSAAHVFYTGTAFEDAHSAEADVLATYRVLLGQFAKYGDLPNSIQGLHLLCNPDQQDWVDSEGKFIWRGNDVFFNFGKHRREPLREVCVTDPPYIEWFLQSDFRAELKTIVAAASQGRLPQRQSNLQASTQPSTDATEVSDDE
jgi:DNA polymerase-3 subunit epsilon